MGIATLETTATSQCGEGGDYKDVCLWLGGHGLADILKYGSFENEKIL
jgi:hypothetical protein